MGYLKLLVEQRIYRIYLRGIGERILIGFSSTVKKLINNKKEWDKVSKHYKEYLSLIEPVKYPCVFVFSKGTYGFDYREDKIELFKSTG